MFDITDMRKTACISVCLLNRVLVSFAYDLHIPQCLKQRSDDNTWFHFNKFDCVCQLWPLSFVFFGRLYEVSVFVIWFEREKKKINGRLNTCLLFTLTKYDVLSLKIIKCDFYWNVKGWTIGIWLLNNYKNWVRIKKE